MRGILTTITLMIWITNMASFVPIYVSASGQVRPDHYNRLVSQLQDIIIELEKRIKELEDAKN